MLFDYGDNWLFVVELIGSGAAEPKTKYPRVIKKLGQAPEQYPEVEEKEKGISDILKDIRQVL